MANAYRSRIVAKAGDYFIINPPAEAGGYYYLPTVHRLMISHVRGLKP